MEDLGELIVSTTASGSIYALVALAYLLILRPTSVINFAVGEWAATGAFIGVAALPGGGDELKVMEVHIFPAATRGTGEGHRPFDLAPRSSMTNGVIWGRVDGVAGPKLTVSHKGGQQTIVVDPKTPVVAFEPAAQGDLKPGTAIVARGGGS